MTRFVAALSAVALLIAAPSSAQTFVSGSTGADGALDLATMNCPGGTCYVQLPPDGVLNYTTVSVPSNRTLIFRPNLRNTPVTILAQGDVTIAGTIDISQIAGCLAAGFDPANECGRASLTASVQAPGPGGFRGGAINQAGFGPGAGAATKPAQWVGPLSLVPLVGGSGGGGGLTSPFCSPAPGAGGAGAIAIASSGKLEVTPSGSVNARGGGYVYYTGSCYFTAAGSSGGAIRLVANNLVVAGGLEAGGGGNGTVGVTGGPGVIRLEGPGGVVTFSGSANPAAVLSAINPVIVPRAPSVLTITSVGGYPVPSYSGQRFDTVDLLLPASLPDPIDIGVSASNIPVGTQVQVTFGTNNSGSVTPGTLSGTLAASTATVQVSGLDRRQLSYLFVSATVSVPQSASVFNPVGADHVERVRVTAEPGRAPQFAFMRLDGSAIDKSRLPDAFLSHFRP